MPSVRAGGGIALDRPLGEARDEPRGRHQLERVVPESRVQHLEDLDLRIPPPLPEQVAHELGVGLVVRCAHVIGGGGEILQPGAQIGGVERAIEALLERALARALLRVKTEQRRRVVAGRGGCRQYRE